MTFKHNPPRRVLLSNIFGIGDVLFTTPVISNLKAAYPGISIGYLCNRRTAPILQNSPKIDKVFIFERDVFAEAYSRSKLRGYRMLMDFIRGIRNEQYDTFIDMSLSDLTGFMAWRAGIKSRIGFKYKSRGFFLNRKFILKGYESRHVIDYYLSLLEDLGLPANQKKMEFFVAPEDDEWAKSFLSRNHLPARSRPLVGVVPGGGASWGKDAGYKRWAPEKYAKLADYLIEKFAVDIILMGDKNESTLCREVAENMAKRPVTACGETTITQFAALARQCALMVVNDGGPLHVAAAAGVRTASIFGPVDERVYGPYPKENHIVITKSIACRPCYRRFRRANCGHVSCLNQLTVDEAISAIGKIL